MSLGDTPQPSLLELVSIDDLLNELIKRFDGGVFAFYQFDPDNEKDTFKCNRGWEGSPYVVLGLAEGLSETIKNTHKDTFSMTLEDRYK